MRIALVFAILALSCAAADAQDAGRGKSVYMEMGCYACHGTTGAGGGPAGPKLAPSPVPLAALTRQLRQPVQRMPRYSPVLLSDAEIGDLHAYLSAIPPGRPAAQIPLLSR